jgi:hypothetical protein
MQEIYREEPAWEWVAVWVVVAVEWVAVAVAVAEWVAVGDPDNFGLNLLCVLISIVYRA